MFYRLCIILYLFFTTCIVYKHASGQIIAHRQTLRCNISIYTKILDSDLLLCAEKIGLTGNAKIETGLLLFLSTLQQLGCNRPVRSCTCIKTGYCHQDCISVSFVSIACVESVLGRTTCKFLCWLGVACKMPFDDDEDSAPSRADSAALHAGTTPQFSILRFLSVPPCFSFIRLIRRGT